MPMTIRVIALVTSACAACLYLFSVQEPNDPYFYLVSSNSAVVVIRLVLSAILVSLVFKSKFTYRLTHRLYGGLALALLVFGVSGIVIAPLDYALFNIIKPLDFIFFIGIGLVFSWATFGHERGDNSLPRLARPRPAKPKLFQRTA